MNDRTPRSREWSRLLVLVAFELVLLIVLLMSGSVMGSAPVLHLSGWLSSTDALTALTALVRLAGLVLASWLIITTLLYGLALRSRSGWWRRGISRLTLPAVRHVLDGAAAASILVSAVVAAPGVASASPAPVAAQEQIAPIPHRAPPTLRATGAPAAAGSLEAPSISDRAVGRHLPHPGMVSHNQEAQAPPAGSVLDLTKGYAGLSAGTKVVVVQPGDCLSVLAERHLGDWRREPEIDRLNRERIQSDGRALEDDHWIFPGWVLVMPADAVGVASVGSPAGPDADPAAVAPGSARTPSPVPVEAGLPSTADLSQRQSRTLRANPGQGANLGQGANPGQGANLGQSVNPGQSALGPRVPESQGEMRPAVQSSSAQPRIPDHSEAPWIEAGVASLAAAGFLLGLSRRRRDLMHARRSGTRVGRNRRPVEVADAQARAVADADAVRWVDLGLRYLGRALLSRTEADVPSIAMVRASREGMEVLVAPPTMTAPPHFEAVDGGALWVLDPSLSSLELEMLATDCWSLLPALVCLGQAADGEVLVNLEHAGSLAVEGDPGRVAAVLAQMALDLRTQPWAEEMLDGLEILSGRDRIPEEAEMAALVSRFRRAAQRYQAELGAAPSAAVRRAAMCQWLPRVVLAGPGCDPDRVSEMVEAAVPDRSGVAIVAVGPVPNARWRLTVEESGEATLSGAVGARRFDMSLRVKADASMVERLEEALASPLGSDADDVAGEDDLEDDLEDEDCVDVDLEDAVVVCSAAEMAARDDELAELDDWDDPDDLIASDAPLLPPTPTPLQPAGDRGTSTPGRSTGYRSDAPLQTELRLAELGLSDPDPTSVSAGPTTPGSVEISFLGPLCLAGGDGSNSVPPNRQASALAIISYLAVKDRPITADELASALWPLDDTKDNFGEPRRKTVMNVISRARSLLGEADAGPRLVLTERGYRLGAEVTCDWVRFEALSAVVPDEAPALAAARLRGALALVRGGPFAGSLASPFYEWVSAQHLDLTITAVVVDTAERLGRLALDTGDRATVDWAVHLGLELDPVREELYQIWMHALGRAGRADQVDEVYRRLCRALQRHIDAGQAPKEETQRVWASYARSPAAKR